MNQTIYSLPLFNCTLLLVIGLNPVTSIEHEMSFIADDMARVDLAESTHEIYEDDGASVTGTIYTRTDNDDNQFTGINLNLQKEAIIDSWQDSSPRYRVSVQFLIESGLMVYDNLDVHVSSCGNFLEVVKPVSDCITDVDKALIYPKIDPKIPDHKHQLRTLLSNHTRYVARRASIKKLNEKVGRDKKLNFKWRLSLPFRCRPELVTEGEDNYFHGIKFVEFNTGEIWCYVELVKSSSEAYTQRNTQHHMHMIREDIEEQDEEYASADESSREEEEVTLYEEPDAKMGSDEDDSTIEEVAGVPTKINIDHSQPQPTLVHSFHTAPDERSKAIVSCRSGNSQGFKAIRTPTAGSKTVVSNTSGKSFVSKSCKSVPNISTALSARKPVTRSVSSKKLDRFQEYFDDFKRKNAKELQDVKQVLDKKFPTLKNFISVPEDKSSSTNFMSLHDDDGSLKITNGHDIFSVCKQVRKMPAGKPSNPSNKRKKPKSTSSSSHSSSSSTTQTKNTKATKGASSNALVVRKSRRVTRSSSKKSRNGY